MFFFFFFLTRAIHGAGHAERWLFCFVILWDSFLCKNTNTSLINIFGNFRNSFKLISKSYLRYCVRECKRKGISGVGAFGRAAAVTHLWPVGYPFWARFGQQLTTTLVVAADNRGKRERAHEPIAVVSHRRQQSPCLVVLIPKRVP